ncbi:MAG: GNAT family N-acetyltransferase [Rickettsiaceae bacterium]|nr:GNAT family N-acetyltransferase [Rickettsiaceae bacterium]
MNIRLLNNEDTQVLEEYLAPHRAECIFICSSIKSAGINYNGADFEGEYFGFFDKNDQLQGVIVHYWNGNIMMHARDNNILEKLISHLKTNISRPPEGIFCPSITAEFLIKELGISSSSFRVNRNEGLYEMNLETLNQVSLEDSMKVVVAQDLSKNILTTWMQTYYIEALGFVNDAYLEQKVQEFWKLRLKKNDSWVLLLNGTPVALSAFRARLEDMVQVGPVWTPPEYRNRGFARLLVNYTLQQEKLKAIKKAVLFAHNPAAIKAYVSVGFKKIRTYRIALLAKPSGVIASSEGQ